eukprot:CAMPEP_0195040298 /NCGR_PEP_ID=MMETSP0326_2-20130528/80257_1 /TAXON_ID=2866 ORGANISM="Crypthecodinium cohnii, Strain Seligo" /NCGR_SAMPLE_ID=MMETSP0326_2 /ASSEMBLY_ACC=CAM_ASM_000348 /LENGTH=134 /DNA_ID=CAMNT_0040067205 /DNA_START=603 /DNA_END=1007 /DNA_ORIENTATION=+
MPQPSREEALQQQHQRRRQAYPTKIVALTALPRPFADPRGPMANEPRVRQNVVLLTTRDWAKTAMRAKEEWKIKEGGPTSSTRGPMANEPRVRQNVVLLTTWDLAKKVMRAKEGWKIKGGGPRQRGWLLNRQPY